MKLLVIGGTIFLGRHLVEAALDRGHEVTLFNRGRHNPELFPQVERIHGDRDGGLSVLAGRKWDAVVDTCGYFPRVVRDSARFFRDATEHYTFVSTISVYADNSQPGMDETAPLATLEDPEVEEITGETYGGLKALCEQAVEEELPGQTLVVRPGLIVGPFDPSDRFTYWPHRVAQGGEVLAPDKAERAVQFIDVRDLAHWMVTMTEQRCTGRFNATGPDYTLSMGQVLDSCNRASGSDATFTWVDESFLLQEGIEPWMGLPLWVPDTAETQGFSAVDCSRAISAGLTFLPLDETVRDTLEWDKTRPEDAERRAGISLARESEVLDAWRRHHSTV